VFAHELAGHASGPTIDENDVFRAVAGVHKRCRGGYAAVAMIPGYGVIAFRDPNGIRPLIFGVREGEHGREMMVASESVALDTLDFERVRDVDPGEAIVFTRRRADACQAVRRALAAQPMHLRVRVFREARLDHRQHLRAQGATAHGQETRAQDRPRAGQVQYRRRDPDPRHQPDLGDEPGARARSALHRGIHQESLHRADLHHAGPEGAQEVRAAEAQPDRREFRGKNVLLVDDSVVRGTTSRQIVQMARDAGARRVYFASAAPPVRYPNVYGIDMPVASELIAHGRSDEEVCAWIGADGMIYQDLEDLIDAVGKKGKTAVQRFDTSVFNGEYVTGDVTRNTWRGWRRTATTKQSRCATVPRRPT
jgi:amidophosphoribosyltransferase